MMKQNISCFVTYKERRQGKLRSHNIDEGCSNWKRLWCISFQKHDPRISAKSNLLKTCVRISQRNMLQKKVKSFLSEKDFVQHSVSNSLNNIFSSKKSWSKRHKSSPKRIKIPLNAHRSAQKKWPPPLLCSPPPPPPPPPLLGFRHSMISSARPLLNTQQWSWSMIRIYHNHTLQTNPWHHEEEPQNTHSNKTSPKQWKQSNQLYPPRQDDCKTKKDIK